MNDQISIQGIPELVNALKKLPEDMKIKCLRPAILKASNVVVNAQKAAAPVGKQIRVSKNRTIAPGELKRSIWRIIKTKDSDIVSFVGPNRKKGSKAFYAHMVIAGTRSHLIKGPVSLNKKSYTNINHPGSKKSDFVQSAWNSSESAAYQTLKDTVYANLSKLGFNS